MRPAERGRQHRHHRQGQEHVHPRQTVLAQQLPQAEHQDHRCQANAHGAQVDRSAAGQGEPKANEDVLVAGAPVFQAQQVAHLGQGDQETGPGHKPKDHRFGDVAGQVAQLEHGDKNLDEPTIAANRKVASKASDRVSGPDDGQGAEDDQRNRVGRTVDQVGRRAEHRGDCRDHDGRIQSKLGIDPGDQRIGHRLGHGDRGDRQTGHEVFAGVAPAIGQGQGAILFALGEPGGEGADVNPKVNSVEWKVQRAKCKLASGSSSFTFHFSLLTLHS